MEPSAAVEHQDHLLIPGAAGNFELVRGSSFLNKMVNYFPKGARLHYAKLERSDGTRAPRSNVAAVQKS